MVYSAHWAKTLHFGQKIWSNMKNFNGSKFSLSGKCFPSQVKIFFLTVNIFPSTVNIFPSTVKSVPSMVKSFPFTVKFFPLTVKFFTSTVKSFLQSKMYFAQINIWLVDFFFQIFKQCVYMEMQQDYADPIQTLLPLYIHNCQQRKDLLQTQNAGLEKKLSLLCYKHTSQ